MEGQWCVASGEHLEECMEGRNVWRTRREGESRWCLESCDDCVLEVCVLLLVCVQVFCCVAFVRNPRGSLRHAAHMRFFKSVFGNACDSSVCIVLMCVCIVGSVRTRRTYLGVCACACVCEKV